MRRAYRRLAKRHHPDRDGSAEAMAAINDAYAALMDVAQRRAYDEALRSERAAARAAGQSPTRV